MTIPSPTDRQPARASARRSLLVALLAVACLVPLPTATVAAGEPPSARERAAPAASRPATRPERRHGGAVRLVLPEGEPSAHYRQAAAHAGDALAFEPGGRVTVPFRPREDDRWEIDGMPGRALPAGHASGRQIRAAEPGALWAAGLPAEVAANRRDELASVDQATGPAVAAIRTGATTPAGPEDARIGSLAAVGPGGLRREVFGFLPYWELTDASTVLDWRTLSTIAYFSVGCTSGGGLWKRNADGSVATGWAGWTSSRMTSVINQAHDHGTRVVLTISCFAWSGSGAATQASLLGSASARRTLARQVAAAVRDRGADGVNLDFEPIVPGYADEYTALIRAVRQELNAVARGYQLTFDAMGSIGNQPIRAATAAGGADAVVIMGYDYRTDGAAYAGSISPLRGPGYDLTDTVQAFLERAPASKLILGVPYYGRAWSTATSQLHARTLKPARFGAVAEPSYAQAVPLAAAYGRRYDRVEESPWTAYRREYCTAAFGCVTTWRQLYYDDAASLKLRYDLVNHAGLRGAAIWALGYDGTRPELRAALASRFLDRAGITDVVLADGGARLLSPNGDGHRDTLALHWVNHRDFASVRLRVFRLDGSFVGSVRLPDDKADAGPTRWEWTGRIDGRRVPAGAYAVQLRGRVGGRDFLAPATNPADAGQLARFGIIVGRAAPTTVRTFESPVDPNRAHTLTWRLHFAGSIGSLSSGDFAVRGTATGCRVGTPWGLGASWSVNVTGCSAGTVGLALQPRTVVDSVRNWGPAGTARSEMLRIDRTAPAASSPRVALRRGEPLVQSARSAGLLAVVSWSGEDRGGAGVRSYDLRRSTDGGPWLTVATGITGSRREVALAPGHTHRFQVRAHDRAGNVGPWVAGTTVVAALRQEGWDAIGWRGGWKGSTWPAFSGGTERYALDRGASVRVTFTGRAIAWVSTLGPRHGAAKVFLDGVLVATIDTHASKELHRRVVFGRTWSTPGTHTLRVVVVGTPGRARVDLDALEVLR